MFREAIAQALEAVSDLEETDPLRVVGFTEVLRAALSGERAPVSPLSTPIPPTRPAVDDRVGRVAERLGTSVEAVQRVFDFGGDRPTLTIQSSQLAASKSGATQQIGLLICAARQAGLDENATSADEIRRVCDEFGRLDDPNFASAMRGLSGALIAEGSARARTYRMTRPGYEQARSLVDRLASLAK